MEQIVKKKKQKQNQLIKKNKKTFFVNRAITTKTPENADLDILISFWDGFQFREQSKQTEPGEVSPPL